MLLVDDLAAGGTKNLRHTPRGLVTLYTVFTTIRRQLLRNSSTLFLDNSTTLLFEVNWLLLLAYEKMPEILPLCSKSQLILT